VAFRALRYVAIGLLGVSLTLGSMAKPLAAMEASEAATEEPVAAEEGSGDERPEQHESADADLDVEDFDELEAELDAAFEEELDDGATTGFPDPVEPVNRGIFAFNDAFNSYLLIPVTKVYQFVVPDPARLAIRRVFANLNEPVVIVNDVLQLEWKDAGRSTTRLVFNSTVGVGGVWDAADYCLGIEPHHADFGQTLALAGAGSGPYFVLPILGPTTARDGAGRIVDALMQPTTYLFGLGQLQLFYSGSQGFSDLEQNANSLEALEESSVDFYAAMHSAFSQQRRAEVWDRREHRR